MGGEVAFSVQSLEDLEEIWEGVVRSVTWRMRERPDSRIEIVVRDVSPGYVAVTRFVEVPR